MAEGVVQLFELTAKDNVSGTVKAINKNLETLRNNLIAEANAVGMSAKQYDLYQASLAGATRDQKTHIAQIHDELSARRATIAMTKAHEEALKMNAVATRNSGKAAGFMNGQLRFMRGGFGQVGHQIQDVAVQLQMGQNGLLVLGQQGSQVASLFGPHGALIGAFIAVGAAVATALLPGLFKSNKELMDMANNANDLIDIYPRLTAAQKEYVELDVRAQISANNKAMLDTIGVIEDLKDETNDFGVIYDMFMNPQKWIVDTNKRNAAIAGQAALTDTLTQKNNDLTDALSGQPKEVRDMVAALEKEAAQVRMTERDIQLLSVAEGENAEATRERMIAAWVAIDVEAARQASMGLSRKAVEDATAAEEARKLVLRDATRAGAKSSEDFLASLKRQAETFGMSSQEALEYSVAVSNLQTTYLDDAEKYVKAIKDKREALELLRKEEAAEAKTRSDFGALQTDLRSELESPEEQLRTQLETRQAIIDEMAALETENKNAFDQARIDAETVFNQAMDALATERAATQLAASATVISSFQSQISAMASMVDEGSALGKAFYLAQQAMAAGMAIIKGYEAAMTIKAAYAAFPGISDSLAAAAIGMGYATAAMIGAQTIASFDGGGYTGDGARSGGLDGKGGRLAMVHPRETILDHTKGQGVGGNVTNININNKVDAAGSGPEVEEKIRMAMEQTSSATIAQIQSLMQRRRFV